jgi:hypothetical protein
MSQKLHTVNQNLKIEHLKYFRDIFVTCKIINSYKVNQNYYNKAIFKGKSKECLDFIAFFTSLMFLSKKILCMYF